jgi:hypothetical protein
VFKYEQYEGLLLINELWCDMTSVDEMMDSTEFEHVQKGTQQILTQMDPEEVQQVIKEEGYEEATEHIDMDPDELENTLQIIRAFADQMEKEYPEAFAELQRRSRSTAD